MWRGIERSSFKRSCTEGLPLSAFWIASFMAERLLRYSSLKSASFMSDRRGSTHTREMMHRLSALLFGMMPVSTASRDRKSTRLNSSHLVISYAVFCLKKKKTNEHQQAR